MHVLLFEIVLQFCGFGACPKTRLARINLFLRPIFGEQAAKFSVKGSNGGMANLQHLYNLQISPARNTFYIT